MGWPEYTLLTLWLLGLGITLERHGEPKKGKENFWVSLAAGALSVWLLYMGGFFA